MHEERQQMWQGRSSEMMEFLAQNILPRLASASKGLTTKKIVEMAADQWACCVCDESQGSL